MKRAMLVTLMIVSIGLFGCSDDNNPFANTMTAQVRVAHLSPDAPNVDVWVDGSVVLEDVPFQAVSGYLELAEGEHNVKVTPAGATTPVVIDANVTLDGGTAYTVAATGLLGSNDLQPIVLVDDVTPANGVAHVRFVHASPDAPAVNVGVTNGPVLFSDISFRSAGDYVSVGQGTYDLAVSVTSSGTPVLTVNGQELQANTNYTIFAIGLAGGGSLAALPVIDASMTDATAEM